MSLEDFINDVIKSNKIAIFSKSYCPFCKMAKEVFNKESEKYIAVELDQREDGDNIQGLLREISGVKTVPQVFLHGKFIGGGTDVKNLHEKGELRKMIDTAGA